MFTTVSVTLVGYVLIPFIIFTFLVKFKSEISIFIVLAALSTISVITISGSDIMAYHLMFVVCVIKYVTMGRGRLNRPKFNLLWFFVIYSGLSIFITHFVHDTYVYNIESVYAQATPSSQQWTQYLYLIFGFGAYLLIKTSVRENRVSVEKIEKTMYIAYFIVLVIGVSQMLLPVAFINTFFRNGVHVIYNTAGARVASTFLEPSFWALFATPMFLDCVARLLKKFNLFLLVCVILNLIMVANNKSSSFFLGVIVGVLGYFIMFLRKRKIRRESFIRGFVIVIVAAVVIFVLLTFFRNSSIVNGFTLLLEKLTQSGTQAGSYSSGVVRITEFVTNFQAFLKNPIFGIGYGTARSADYLSVLLAETGIIGAVLFGGYMINLLRRLHKSSDARATRYFVLVLTSLAIMLISVPEMTIMSFWICLAIGEAVSTEETVTAEREAETEKRALTRETGSTWNARGITR